MNGLSHCCFSAQFSSVRFGSALSFGVQFNVGLRSHALSRSRICVFVFYLLFFLSHFSAHRVRMCACKFCLFKCISPNVISSQKFRILICQRRIHAPAYTLHTRTQTQAVVKWKKESERHTHTHGRARKSKHRYAYTLTAWAWILDTN